MNRIFILVLIVTLFSCGNKKSGVHSDGKRAFYYWQTSLDDFDWQDSTFQTFKTKKIYYRFFDVDWSDEAKAPVPVAQLNWQYLFSWKTEAAAVPVVFLTNETFKNLNVEQSRELAHHVHHKVFSIMSSLLTSDVTYELDQGYWQQDPYLVKSKDFREHTRYDSMVESRLQSVVEIQFDCDWTESTRDKYFAFLQESGSLFKDKVISSTIRLYQYKYPDKAGIPPVKRAMLMCYNAGDIRNSETANSIFDKKEIMSYVDDGDYKLPLDYALPIFDWALLYQDGKLKKILPINFLTDYSTYLEGEAPKLKVNEDFIYGFTSNSILIRKGDEIRVESPDMNDVIELASFLGDHKNNDESVITLYHLNNYDIQKHSKEIETIFDSF